MTAPASYPGERERRLDEAVAEYLEAVDAGRRPAPAEWLARYPDLAPELERFFAGQEQVCNLLDSLGPTPTVDHLSTGAEAPPPAGDSLPYFGDYELLEEIARGGMGVVYKARQVSLNRTVALKMILAGRLASPGDVQRFRSEAEAAANLDHPNVVPIYEVGEHEGQHYFSMKLIEGGSLARHAGRFRDDPRGAARLLATVARAVHHAHQRGLLHRDLKPANILIDAQGEPHLTDFGLARRLDGDAGLTRTGTAVGTPSYMAPEQAGGPRAAATTAADVYSLGAILYELLTGRPPFRAEHPLETLRQVLEREPVRPRALAPGVDRDLETVCLKCLDKEPARRYASAAELADDLERFLRGEPVRARRAGAAERLWRWCRRRPIIAALSAALAVSLLVGAVLITWQWRRAEAHLHEVEFQYGRAEDQRARAESEWARAEEAFKSAHAAVNDFCTGVSEGRMRDIPGLQPERKKLLERALAYYEKFLRERGDDPALRRELADTHSRIASITALMGSKTKALEAYGRAQAAYEELLRAEPRSASVRVALAETIARTAVVLSDLGRADEALTTYQEAARRYEELRGERPGDLGLQNGTAAVYNNVASLHRSAGRLVEARDFWRRARELQEDLTRRRPAEAEFRANLALTYCNIAALESGLSQGEDAVALYRKGHALLEKLVAQDPMNLRYQRDFASTGRSLAGVLCTARKFDEALRAMEQSQAILDRLVRAEPGIPRLRSDLAAGYRQTGHIYRDSNRLKEALAQYDQALAVMATLAREHPDVLGYRNDLAKAHFDRASVLHRKGAWDEARKALEPAVALRRELVVASPGNLGYQSDLGLTFGSLSVALANLRRYEDALAAARDSIKHHRIAFDGAPKLAIHRRFLSGAYARLTSIATDRGSADEAVAAALERKKLWPEQPHELYAVAADLARAARKAGGGPAADLAMATLREAVDAGFRDGTRLRGDAAFTALRGRPEFDALLAELSPGKDGPE